MKTFIEDYRQNVDTKLIFRQRIFIVVIFILIIISVVNVFEGKISALLAVSGFLISAIIGLVLSRIFKILWHEEKGKVIYQLDKLSITLLVIYIIIEIGRKWFLEHWLTGAALSAFGLIVLMGLLSGRFLGTMIKIKRVLEDENVT